MWLLMAAALVVSSCAKKEEAEPKPLVTVKVAKVETADIPLSVSAPATIFAKTQASVAARITAPIREMRVKKGDNVGAGQTLAVLEDRDLIAQRQEAAAAVADAQANLQKTTSGTIPADIDRARGQVETTQAALNQSQKTYDRRKALFQQGAIPERDLLVSETELATARSNYEVARKAYEKGQGRGSTDLPLA